MLTTCYPDLLLLQVTSILQGFDSVTTTPAPPVTDPPGLPEWLEYLPGKVFDFLQVM